MQLGQTNRAARRNSRLKLIGCFMIFAWFVKVLVEMVFEYRFYFPADFSSYFLMGKQGIFYGAYRLAFYSHIVCGPIAVSLGAYLMFTGGSGKRISSHRLLGRIQMLIVLLVIVPSGLIMATQAYTGMIAVLGFSVQAIGTGVCGVAAVWAVLNRRIESHQKWASRCFVFLCSPLILRVVSGGTIVMQVDTDTTYKLTAWGSWLVPILIQEFYWIYRARKSPTTSVRATNGATTNTAMTNGLAAAGPATNGPATYSYD